MQASKPNNELVPMLEEFPKWLFDVSVPLLPEPPKWKFPNPKLLFDSTCILSDPQWAVRKNKKNDPKINIFMKMDFLPASMF